MAVTSSFDVIFNYIVKERLPDVSVLSNLCIDIIILTTFVGH